MADVHSARLLLSALPPGAHGTRSWAQSHRPPLRGTGTGPRGAQDAHGPHFPKEIPRRLCYPGSRRWTRAWDWRPHPKQTRMTRRVPALPSGHPVPRGRCCAESSRGSLCPRLRFRRAACPRSLGATQRGTKADAAVTGAAGGGARLHDTCDVPVGGPEGHPQTLSPSPCWPPSPVTWR